VAPNSLYQSEFESYWALAVGLPGERALQQQGEQLIKQSSDVSVSLLAPSDVSASQIVESATLSEKTLNTLEALQGLYNAQIKREIAAAHAAESTTETVLVISAAIASIVVFTLSALVVRVLRRDTKATQAQVARDELEGRLQRALEMSESEQDVFQLVHNAIATTEPALHAELLVADSSRAHLHQVVTRNVVAEAGCGVTSPTSCPAAAQGQTRIFESSTALDACPYLGSRSGSPCSAICVPVNIAGRPMGVMHATADNHDVPSSQVVTELELIARRAGERLSLLRAFAKSEIQASTDPLTGLLNRRSLEASTQELVETGERYVVAYGDLDHFKILNDVHGHDTGDRALRLFSRVLRDNVRPSDIPARYGGEEFVVVLPHCTATDAGLVIERVRQRLAAALRDGNGPEFTVSFGIAASTITQTFTEVVEVADNALLQAKATGRNTVVIAGAEDLIVPDDASSILDMDTRPDDPHSGPQA
jgi:diguanylate cyclase (GGDEF)-like protein